MNRIKRKSTMNVLTENKFFCGSGLFVLSYLILRWYLQGGWYRKSTRCDGKVILITGANTGIGKETAIELARRGGKIYMACRSLERATKACEEIKAVTGSKNIFVRELDLSSFESIRTFADQFTKEENRLDILINNAGVMVCPKSCTKDGLETQIGVNHFGHFLLTHLLLDLLKKSQPSRVIVVSSLAHLYGKINKEDINSERSYNKVACYCQSKLANILFTKELARRLKGTGVTVNALNPGTVDTDLSRHLDSISVMFRKIIIKPLEFLFYKTPKAGCQTTLFCALDPELDNVSGKYFADCKEAKVAPSADDQETANWLWNISEKMTGLASKIE